MNPKMYPSIFNHHSRFFHVCHLVIVQKATPYTHESRWNANLGIIKGTVGTTERWHCLPIKAHISGALRTMSPTSIFRWAGTDSRQRVD